MTTADQCRNDEAENRREYVVLHRRSFYEFMGKMALPPWRDTDGKMIGGNIDCVPIAQEIIEWTEAHDLADVYLGGSNDAVETDRLANRVAK